MHVLRRAVSARRLASLTSMQLGGKSEPSVSLPGRSMSRKHVSLEMRKSEPEWSEGCFTMPTEMIS